jgi:ACR3 family arsenite transporter
MEKNSGIGFFEKYLTLWVILCMAAGVLIGRFLPVIPAFWGVLNMRTSLFPSRC